MVDKAKARDAKKPDPWYPAPPKEGASSFLSNTFLVVAGIAAAVAIAWVAARGLHRFDPGQQIMVSDLVAPAGDSGGQTPGNFGKEVADLFAGDLNEVIVQGSDISGNQHGRGKSRISQPFDGIPNIPVSKSYGIEIQGISIDQLLNIWNSLRYDQQQISGDIILASHSPDRYMVELSLHSENRVGHFESGAFLPTRTELVPAIQSLAEQFVIGTNPEIAGRYFLATKQYSRAVQVFMGWLSSQPERPEPNLYLAKTFILEDEWERAEPFADSALRSAALVAPKNQEKMQIESQLAKAVALWGSGKDVEGAKALFLGPLQNQPGARTNLAILYLGKRQYQEAEKLLQGSKGPRDLGAAIVLGQTYIADNNPQMAVTAFQKALQFKPTSTEAADSYVAALHAAGRDQDAVQYCHAWVGTAIDSDALATDTTPDLYVLCAQAEQAVKSPNNLALAWYDVEAVNQSDTEGDQAALFGKLVDSMPAVICQGSKAEAKLTKGNLSADQTALLSKAAQKLAGILKKRAPEDPKSGDLAKACTLEVDYLK